MGPALLVDDGNGAVLGIEAQNSLRVGCARSRPEDGVEGGVLVDPRGPAALRQADDELIGSAGR